MRGVLPALLLGLLLTACAMDQPRSWREEPKPWDPKSVANAYRVRVHTTDGEEITLFRAAIVEENGREVLVGRVWDPRGDSDSTRRLDLNQVDRLEMQRMGPVGVGTRVSESMVLLGSVLAIVLILSLF